MREKNPNEAALFLQNWSLLDRVVKTSLTAPAPPSAPVLPMNTAAAAGGKRTKSSKKTRRNKRR